MVYGIDGAQNARWAPVQGPPTHMMQKDLYIYIPYILIIQYCDTPEVVPSLFVYTKSHQT